MARKFIFLINPISGTASKQSLPELVKQAAKKHGVKAEILPTTASGNYDFVKQKIKEERYTEVVICGGDGSVNTVIQQLRDTPVNFGIIPLGSGNGLALGAKIPKALPKAIENIFTGTPVLIDAFYVNDSFACMLCGLGFDAKVAHDFAHQKTRGLLTYTQQSIKNFFSASPYSFEISWGDHKLTTEAYFISIANSNQFGNQVTIAPKASLTDGLLDIVIVQKMNKLQLPIAVLQQITGGKPRKDDDPYPKTGILYFQTPAIKIKNLDNAPLHIDGEPLNSRKNFTIKVIPECFRLILP